MIRGTAQTSPHRRDRTLTEVTKSWCYSVGRETKALAWKTATAYDAVNEWIVKEHTSSKTRQSSGFAGRQIQNRQKIVTGRGFCIHSGFAKKGSGIRRTELKEGTTHELPVEDRQL